MSTAKGNARLAESRRSSGASSPDANHPSRSVARRSPPDRSSGTRSMATSPSTSVDLRRPVSTRRCKTKYFRDEGEGNPSPPGSDPGGAAAGGEGGEADGGEGEGDGDGGLGDELGGGTKLDAKGFKDCVSVVVVVVVVVLIVVVAAKGLLRGAEGWSAAAVAVSRFVVGAVAGCQVALAEAGRWPPPLRPLLLLLPEFDIGSSCASPLPPSESSRRLTSNTAALLHEGLSSGCT